MSVWVRSPVARLAVAVLVAVGLSGAGLVPAAASTRQTSTRQTSAYVSLGDSLAFGYQPNLFAAGDYNPADYRGYAEDYTSLHPRLQLANFGCPGETSTTLINQNGTFAGACSWLQNGLPLHMPYGGYSQLDAAVTYLQAHPNTSQISVDIGSNDLLAVVGYCRMKDPTDLMGCLTTQLPGTLVTLAANYSTILAALHHAAPQAHLVVFNLYNPLALAVPGSDALLTNHVNPVIDQVAASYGASVADAFTAINYKAGSLAEAFFVCVRTWECTKYQDVHPTFLGYWRLAFALEEAVS